MTLGERIKARRKELKLSQTELANRTGYADKSAISKIESGAIDLGQSGIVTFARALETSVAYLMGWTEETPQKPLTSQERAILEAYHNATPFVQRMVLYTLGIEGDVENGEG